MPELPEVETVRTAIESQMKGLVINKVTISDKKMRWPIPQDLPEQITGGVIMGVRRRAKYLLIDIDMAHDKKWKLSGLPKENREEHKGIEWCLLIHLGMSGSVRIYPPDRTPDSTHDSTPKQQKHDHLIICAGGHHLSKGQDTGLTQMVLNDPRRFGGAQLIKRSDQDQHPLLRALGAEPLGNQWNGEALKEALKGRKTSIKAALLDQRVVSGIGNIYASEALHQARISPRRQAGTISKVKAEALSTAVKDVLMRAIASGGTSLRDHVQPGGEIGYFVQKLHVYGREGQACHHCGSTIKLIRQAGRSSFYCPQCQR
jgi:formamidopyrimidine-DNA glycosylase